MSIVDDINAFTANAYKAHECGELIDYVIDLLASNRVYATEEEDWRLFMQLCYNQLPKDEELIQQYLGRLDTYHLVGLSITHLPTINSEALLALLRLLAKPHIRINNTIYLDYVETLPITLLSKDSQLVEEISINVKDGSVRLTLNPELVIFYTYDNLDTSNNLLLLDLRKIDLTIDYTVLENSLTYLYYKHSDRTRCKALYEHVAYKYSNSSPIPYKTRYNPLRKQNKKLVDAITYLVTNKILNVPSNNDYVLLNNSWSFCITAFTSGKDTRRYYTTDNQLTLI